MQKQDSQVDEQTAAAASSDADDQGQSCTLYLPRADYEVVWQCVRDSGLVFSLEGTPRDWGRIRVVDGQEELVLTSLRKEAPGDKLSRILLGTLDYFERIPSAPEDRLARIVDSVEACEMTIGARAQKDFTDAHMDVIFAIAAATNGLIFNGSGMIDAGGHLILDANGNFDPI